MQFFIYEMNQGEYDISDQINSMWYFKNSKTLAPKNKY